MTELADLPIRDDLRGFSPYGAPQIDVPIQLNVNENNFGIPGAVADDIVAAVAAVVGGVHRYPDREFTALRDALAAFVGGRTAREQIWAANGSNEVIQQFLQAFGGPGRSMLGFTPSYSMYPLYARGTHTRWIAAERDTDFTLSAEAAVAAVEREQPEVVVLARPNNPTGTALGLDVIEAVYAATQGMVLVDEAYQEFSELPSAVELLPGRPRLAVSRTMSKAFAFAGVRLGYLIADPAVCDALRLVRLPYHLSALTQAAATAALAHAPAMLANVDAIKAQRDRISRALPGLGYAPWPSESNFVLFGGVADPHRTFGWLVERGIIVRETPIANSLRVTAGTPEETTAFLEALADAPNT